MFRKKLLRAEKARKNYWSWSTDSRAPNVNKRAFFACFLPSVLALSWANSIRRGSKRSRIYVVELVGEREREKGRKREKVKEGPLFPSLVARGKRSFFSSSVQYLKGSSEDVCIEANRICRTGTTESERGTRRQPRRWCHRVRRRQGAVATGPEVKTLIEFVCVSLNRSNLFKRVVFAAVFLLGLVLEQLIIHR